MEDINQKIDDNPSLSSSFVEADIRNVQAQRELESYNNTGNFIGKHPLVIDFFYRRQTNDELRSLKRDNPAKFVTDVANLQQNIRRIKSNIARKKYRTGEELKGWQDNLLRSEIKLELIMDILRD